MFSWLNTPKPPETNWSEVSYFYVELYKHITHSEIDREEFPVVYGKVPSLPVGGKGFGIDFSPQTILSCFFVQSRKGNKRSGISCFAA